MMFPCQLNLKSQTLGDPISKFSSPKENATCGATQQRQQYTSILAYIAPRVSEIVIVKSEMSDSNGSTSTPPDDTEKVSVPLEILIGERLEQLAPLSASCSIYRVPERIRCLNPNVYTPKTKLIRAIMLRLRSFHLNDIGVDCNLETVNSSEVKVEHFLDITRTLCLPPEPQVGGTRNPAAICAPSITELHRAGVKLKVRSIRNLFSIRFENGILEIPKLTISDDSERILRNLAAYEQCHYWNKRIGDYLDLLDSFINTPNNVELLVKYGIVTNVFGDGSEACSTINSLCKGVLGNYNDFCFATLYEDLHNHCKKPWNKWKANLRENYLNTPWAIVSVVAAVFLIILTVIQTVCSLISL
ncbi:hypothetical protein ACLB2K_014550 [Fragaria x ananassa]